MDISVLERQRAVLQRLYEQNHGQETDYFTLDSVVNHQHQVLSNANNWQCNSVLPNKGANSPIKKRKAEFDVEDEESKGKGVDAEEITEEKSEITTKTERETSTNNSSKVSEVQKPDYIHVRARRGQATDSHSLAERARREKISKKMKCLQDLVPGCNKVTGKAGMLDEIINYVQSLQKQVEFLSMKLAAINPRLEFSVDNLFADKIPAYIANIPAAATQFEATNVSCFEYNSDISMDQSQMLPQKPGISSMPTPEMFLDSSLFTQLSGWESDWPGQFNVGFH